MLIPYSRGSHEVNVGDTFFTPMSTKPGSYRIKALHGLEDHNGKRQITAYSPVGLGGTVIIGCENIRTGEVVDFCGDSVAALLATPEEEPADWDEEAQTARNREIYGLKP